MKTVPHFSGGPVDPFCISARDSGKEILPRPRIKDLLNISGPDTSPRPSVNREASESKQPKLRLARKPEDPR